MMVKVLASGFYARQDIKTPVKVGALVMVINSLLCLLFIWPLAHAGLTLASALAGYINCAILLFLLKRRGIYQPMTGWFKYILQLGVANTAVAVYLLLMTGNVSFWLAQSPVLRLTWLLAHVAVAVMIYFISLYMTGIRPAQFRGHMKE